MCGCVRSPCPLPKSHPSFCRVEVGGQCPSSSEGLEGSWSLSLEKVCAEAQRHGKYAGVWEGWLGEPVIEMRPQGWAAEA